MRTPGWRKTALQLMEDEKALALVFLQTRFQKGLEQALRQAAEKKKTPADRARR